MLRHPDLTAKFDSQTQQNRRSRGYWRAGSRQRSMTVTCWLMQRQLTAGLVVARRHRFDENEAAIAFG